MTCILGDLPHGYSDGTLCWIGDQLRPARDHELDLPGGEGPESDVGGAAGSRPRRRLCWPPIWRRPASRRSA